MVTRHAARRSLARAGQIARWRAEWARLVDAGQFERARLYAQAIMDEIEAALQTPRGGCHE